MVRNKDLQIGEEKVNDRTRKILRVFAWIFFGAYLIFLSYFLFFAEITGRTYTGRTYHYNLVPFKEIHRFWKYRESLGFFVVFMNLAGNVIAFIPYGMLIPLLSHKNRHFWRVVLLSFNFSLFIEITQLITKVGSCDVDDIILNTTGGAIGFACFLLADYLRNHLRRNKNGT